MVEFDIYKKKYGKSFIYVHIDGERVIDKNILKYCKELYFPPAYKNICINSDINAKRYGVATDEKNRKQFFYTKEWCENAQHEKSKQIYKFSKYICRLKKDLFQLLDSPISKPHLISLALLLIIECNFRIGSEEGVENYQSYGVTTLKKSHFELKNKKYHVSFTGKKGVINENIIKNQCINKAIHNLIRKNKNNEIFNFKCKDTNQILKISNKDVNSFLKQYGDFSSKNLRTWMANIWFLTFVKKQLQKYPKYEKFSSHRTKIIKNSIDLTAKKLHHTAIICKKSYLFYDLWHSFYKNPSYFMLLRSPKSFLIEYLKNIHKKKL